MQSCMASTAEIWSTGMSCLNEIYNCMSSANTWTSRRWFSIIVNSLPTPRHDLVIHRPLPRIAGCPDWSELMSVAWTGLELGDSPEIHSSLTFFVSLFRTENVPVLILMLTRSYLVLQRHSAMFLQKRSTLKQENTRSALYLSKGQTLISNPMTPEEKHVLHQRNCEKYLISMQASFCLKR